MAVTTVNRIAGPFIGNGSTTVFPFVFKVFTTDNLYVLLQDSAGTVTILVLGTDYSATLNGNQDTNPGGSITLTAGPLTYGYRMTITSDVPELQNVILTNLGGFYPGVLNDEFDWLTILIQQLQLVTQQCIRFGLTDDLTTAQLPSAPQRAGKFLYFGSDGFISLVAQVPGGGTSYNFRGPLLGTKDGTNTVFTITNGGSPIGKTPTDIFAWRNFDLIQDVGFSLGPLPGQLTFATTPNPTDDLAAKGSFVP